METLIKNIGKFGASTWTDSIEGPAIDEYFVSVLGGELLIHTYITTTQSTSEEQIAFDKYKPIWSCPFDSFKIQYVKSERRMGMVVKYVNDRLKQSNSDLEWTHDDNKFILRRIREEEVEQARKKVKYAEECVELFQSELEEKITELKKAKAELQKLLPL